MIRSLFEKLEHLPADGLITAADETSGEAPGSPENTPADTASGVPEGHTLHSEPPPAYRENELKKARRMTLPDPKSLEVPRAGLVFEENESEKPPENAVPEANDIDPAAENTPNPVDLGPQFPQDPGVLTPSLPSYGVPALSEIFRVTLSLLDPRAESTNDSMRFLGMNVLMSLLESHGTHLTLHSTLLKQVQDTACKFLFQLAQTDNTSLMSYALRAIQTLFDTAGKKLKWQFEFFLRQVFVKLAPTFPLALEPWKEGAGIGGGHGANSSLLSFPRSSPLSPSMTSSPPAPPPPPPQPKTSGMAPLTGEARELYVETVISLVTSLTREGGDPYITLWANYDVEVDSDNLVEELIRFWSRSVFAQAPSASSSSGGTGGGVGAQGGQDSLQMVALDAIIGLVKALYVRQQQQQQGAQGLELGSSDTIWPSELLPPAALAAKKEHKATLIKGAEEFNRKPKDGIAFFRAHGLLPAAPASITSDEEESATAKKRDNEAVARFLRACPRLDKKGLGEYLASPNNTGVLSAFIGLFDFSGTNVADGLRRLLEAFRLPGEAQQISRITETFASHYFSFAPPGIASVDAVYVLAFSVIMLNTDQHNPQAAKRRMQLEDYCRNLRGVNEGKDFDQKLLAELYTSIKQREIIMPEEHAGAAGFDYAWNQLLARGSADQPQSPVHVHDSAHDTNLLCSSTSENLVPCRTDIFDRTIFERAWRPLVAALAHGFSTFRDEQLLERAIAGFRQCAALASQFGMVELFDFMAQTLAEATGLLDDELSVGVNNARVERQMGGLTDDEEDEAPNGVSGDTGASGSATQASEGARAETDSTKPGGNEPDILVVGPLSVRFGLNFKGQMAAVVLFNITNGNGHSIHTSWPAILRIAKNLFAHSLVPPELNVMYLFGKPPEDIPLRPKRLAHAPAPDQRGQGGIFSTLSSYLLAGGPGGGTLLGGGGGNGGGGAGTGAYGGYETPLPPPPDVTTEDVEATLCTLDCLASCRIEEIFAQMADLEGDTFLQAVIAARELTDWYTLDRVSAAQSLSTPTGGGGRDSGSSSPARRSGDAPASSGAGESGGASTPTLLLNGLGSLSGGGAATPRSPTRLVPPRPVQLVRGQLPYDPAAMFLEERLTGLVVGAHSLSEPAWRLALDHFIAILSDAGRFHPLLVERAVVSVLRLLAVAPLHEEVGESRVMQPQSHGQEETTQAQSLEQEQPQVQQPQSQEKEAPIPPAAVRDAALIALDALRAIPSDLLPAMAEQLILGLGEVLASRGRNLLIYPTEWAVVLSLIGQCGFACNAVAASEAFLVVRDLALGTPDTPSLLSPANYGGVIALLRDFGFSSDLVAVARAQRRDNKPPPRRTLTEKKAQADYDAAAQQRGLDAIRVLGEMRYHAARLVQSAPHPRQEAWGHVWIALLDALAQQVLNGYRSARHESLGIFQKILLAPELLDSFPAPSASQNNTVKEAKQEARDDAETGVDTTNGKADEIEAGVGIARIFHAVLFPALDSVLSPAAAALDAQSLGETCARLSGLLSKALLLYLPVLSSESEVPPFGSNAGIGGGTIAPLLQVWEPTLDLYRRMLLLGRRVRDPAVSEALPETLKNVLLVMHASGLLVRPPPHTSPSSGTGGGEDEEKNSGAPRGEAIEGSFGGGQAPLQQAIWTAAETRLTTVLPGLLEQVAPPYSTSETQPAQA